VHFERVVARQAGERWEDVNYVPDVQPDGSVAGYFVMVEDITERKTAQTLVWRQANYDQLTGLPNRGMFIERLRHELSARGRWPQSMAILFIDLDGFKAVNDTHGHASGDLLLKQAAARMQRALRETDMVARLAGDEFTVLLAGVHGRPDAQRIAQGLLAALSAPFELDGREVSVSASAGISFAPEDSDDADELLKQADQAMYCAKRDGRCGLAFHRPATTVQPPREDTDVLA
jgi:diguanylate cyclase (GGDEF)-like protein